MYGRLVEVEGVDPSKREGGPGDHPGEDHSRAEGDRRLRRLHFARGRGERPYAVRGALGDEGGCGGSGTPIRGEARGDRAGGTVQSADLYEAPIVEVRTGVCA